ITPEEAAKEKIFIEQNGYVSIEAENFARRQESGTIHWTVIPHFGKTLSGVTTLPQNEYPSPEEDIYLEYDILFESTGEFEVQLLLAPTLNFNDNKGLRYVISFDEETPQQVNFNGHYRGELGRWQAEHIIRSGTRHTITEPGIHTLRCRVLDPGIVLQKIVIDTGGLNPSYLGPPESRRKSTANLKK
ncbi:MAG TPA: glycosyhydrolase, partial [Proteiniphilum sp.]|nr:glycosyhydrolase [Proteiniphilum sp.]